MSSHVNRICVNSHKCLNKVDASNINVKRVDTLMHYAYETSPDGISQIMVNIVMKTPKVREKG